MGRHSFHVCAGRSWTAGMSCSDSHRAPGQGSALPPRRLRGPSHRSEERCTYLLALFAGPMLTVCSLCAWHCARPGGTAVNMVTVLLWYKKKYIPSCFCFLALGFQNPWNFPIGLFFSSRALFHHTWFYTNEVTKDGFPRQLRMGLVTRKDK